jgi:hypothetical protein
MQRSIAAPSIVRLMRSSAASARTICSRDRNSAEASTAQKAMKASAASGELATNDASAVCTENLIRVDDVMESPKLTE